VDVPVQTADNTATGVLSVGNAFTVTFLVTVVVLPLPFVTAYEIVAVPPPTPVTCPLDELTMATPVLDEEKVPPEVVELKVVVKPAQIVFVPVNAFTVGLAFTVTDDVVLVQPVDVCVYVNDAEPADNPVTTPPLVTVATAELLLPHVPPVAGDKVIVLLTHTEDGAVTTGSEFTVKVNPFPALKQPLAFVTISVPEYVPATTPAATERLIGLAGNAALFTFTNPAVVATEFQ